MEEPLCFLHAFTFLHSLNNEMSKTAKRFDNSYFWNKQESLTFLNIVSPFISTPLFEAIFSYGHQLFYLLYWAVDTIAKAN